MNVMAPQAIGVEQPVDTRRANESARNFAKKIGFTTTESEQIALVVTELATNLVKHAGGGAIKLSMVQSGEHKGIHIESEDSGPGIPDVEAALTDGFSTVGSLGAGLGAVNRLMDKLDFQPRSKEGLRIICERWLRPKPAGVTIHWLEFGAATRAYRMLPQNGDAIILKEWNGNALTGVIDGLGHGNFAQKAAHTARQYVEQHFDQPLPSIFLGVGRACRATRGVVMSLGRFDLGKRTVSLASVGNVETRLIGGARMHMIVRRGILGLSAPNAVVTEHEWTNDSLLVIHSDGLRAHWNWDEFQDVAREHPSAIARAMLNKLGKLEDDATVVVVKNAKS